MAVLFFLGIKVKLLIVKVSKLGYSSLSIVLKVFCQEQSLLLPTHQYWLMENCKFV